MKQFEERILNLFANTKNTLDYLTTITTIILKKIDGNNLNLKREEIINSSKYNINNIKEGNYKIVYNNIKDVDKKEYTFYLKVREGIVIFIGKNKTTKKSILLLVAFYKDDYDYYKKYFDLEN